jgi:hypothetical protein
MGAAMAFRHEGNGHPKAAIDFNERPGYVFICPRDPDRLPATIAGVINTARTNWLKRNLGIRVRTAVLITRDGQTVAVHLWYDRADVAG